MSHQDVAVQKHEAAAKGLRHVYPLVLQLTDGFEQDSVRNLIFSFFFLMRSCMHVGVFEAETERLGKSRDKLEKKNKSRRQFRIIISARQISWTFLT